MRRRNADASLNGSLCVVLLGYADGNIVGAIGAVFMVQVVLGVFLWVAFNEDDDDANKKVD